MVMSSKLETFDIKIGDRIIGKDRPCYVIAEAGVNHNGDPEVALQLVDAAVAAGADAVKFQTFSTERVVTRDAPKALYQIETTAANVSQFEMLQALELSADVHRDIQNYCRMRGITFLSSPFDETSADFLEELNVPAFKIPSGELTNLPFLTHVSRKGKPMIVSTGMASLKEVETAVAAIRKGGNINLVLLHCVSAYPAKPADVNLRAMQTMAGVFGTSIGFSDHTLGIEVALAAVALGAQVIEKHFTLDCSLPGPDHRASLEPQQLTALVRGIRVVEAALGHGRKEPSTCESDVASVSRKSIVAARDIAAKTILSGDLLCMKCPGTGLPAAMLEQVIGKVAVCNIPAGTFLTSDMLQ